VTYLTYCYEVLKTSKAENLHQRSDEKDPPAAKVPKLSGNSLEWKKLFNR